MAVYSQAIRPPSDHGMLALLSPHNEEPSACSSLLQQLGLQARKYGYQVELLHYHVPGISGKQLTRILKARGTAGLIVLPGFIDSKALRRLQIDWELFPAVALGHALFWPSLHRVSEDHLSNARLLVRKLISLGHRRIGLCLQDSMAALHSAGGWEGGYLAEMRRLGDIPSTFYRKTAAPDEEEVQAIRSWILRERLDAVITDTDVAAYGLYSQGCFLPPITVPSDIGLACLALYSDFFAGVNPGIERIWTTAVDLLIHLTHTNQRGIPKFPRRTLIEGTWMPGKTVRRRN